MKKILFPLLLLMLFAGCAKAEHYSTPFETGGKVYKIALLPWKTTTMTFDFKYRWTMTQALMDACKESGAFDFVWSAYPVNGGDVQVLQNIDRSGLWQRIKYGKYIPVVKAVTAAVSGLDADLAVLYVISADNSAASDEDSLNYRDDFARIFLVDTASGQITMEFIRTDFLRKRAFADIKRVTLRAFYKWLSAVQQDRTETKQNQ